MRLETITVGNFKNIAETTLHVDKMIAVVSANNYGKTNLLEAIRFGFDFMTASPKTRKNMMCWLPGIPLSPLLAGKEYIFSVEFDAPDLCEYRYVRYSFRFSWLNDLDGGAVITDETLEMRANKSVRYTGYLKRDKQSYRSGKGTASYRKISLAKDVLAIDILSAVDKLDFSNVITQLKNLNCRMCQTLQLDNSFRLSPIEFNSEMLSATSFGDEDIPKALSALMDANPEMFDLFLETIYDLFPEFEKIELQVYAPRGEERPEIHGFKIIQSEDEEITEEEEPQIPYRIKDEWYRLVIESSYLNQPIGMEYMSTGTKRIIWLIANAVFAEYYGTNVIGVDEIETSIHPRMIRNLLESLDFIAGDISMIVTSHSPYLIQYFKPQSIYIGVPNREGVATFKRIEDKKIKTLLRTSREMKLSIGEYLFELMSGDEDSASILSAYLEK